MDDRRVRVATKSPFEEWKQRENAKELYFGERAVAELRVLHARYAQLLMQLQKERAQAVKKQEEYALSMTLMTTISSLEETGVRRCVNCRRWLEWTGRPTMHTCTRTGNSSSKGQAHHSATFRGDRPS